MRVTGTVKFFNRDKGYGFIQPDGGQNDVFVHISALQKSGIKELSQDQRVSFTTRPDRKGKSPQAADLEILQEPAHA